MEKLGFQVHIRVQQRNGRKSITLIEGIHIKTDFDLLIKSLKKELCCNGCVICTESGEKILQLQGDQRENVKNFFILEKLAFDNNIKIHGT